MTIRTAREDDALAIADIYAPHVENGTASFELEAPDAAEIRRRMETVADAGLPYLVAEEEGRVVGYAYASIFRPRPAYRHTVESSIYVHEEFHRRGIGRNLMLQLFEACSNKGIREIVVAIANPSENVASVEMHEALGFREVGTLKGIGYKHGEALDVLQMQKHVTLAEGR